MMEPSSCGRRWLYTATTRRLVGSRGGGPGGEGPAGAAAAAGAAALALLDEHHIDRVATLLDDHRSSAMKLR